MLKSGLSARLAGGLGSSLAWAGGNTYISLQDRRPNAKAWNPAVDNTPSRFGRFQSPRLQLNANAAGAALPFSLTPTLSGSTMPSSPAARHCGAGGAPALNSVGASYFSGRSDNFAAGLPTNSNNARLDPEALRLWRDGKRVFVSDEYDPCVYQFDRASG